VEFSDKESLLDRWKKVSGTLPLEANDMSPLFDGLKTEGNAFAFLRSLPIRPREIVGAKYVAVLVTLAFVVVLAVAGPAGAASGTAAGT
jgi:hypothetical protein